MQTQRGLDEFKNEPFVDYSKAENAAAMRAAIEKVRSKLGREYPNVINGEKITLESKFQSINPANKAEVVGVFSEVDTDTTLVERAIESASAAFKVWRNVSVSERADYLFRIADILRQRKHEFSAWMVFEVAKTWSEADGDTAEVRVSDHSVLHGPYPAIWPLPILNTLRRCKEELSPEVLGAQAAREPARERFQRINDLLKFLSLVDGLAQRFFESHRSLREAIQLLAKED